MDNPQAFPHLEPRDPSFSYCDNGMTLLDYFAARAMVATIAATSAGQHSLVGSGTVYDKIAQDAYKMARAMLTARKEATDDPA